jgi:hypothetical protein
VRLKVEISFELRGVSYQVGDMVEIQPDLMMSGRPKVKTVAITGHNDQPLYHACVSKKLIFEHTTDLLGLGTV